MRRPAAWRSLRGRLALAIGAGLLTAAVIFAAVASGLIRNQSQTIMRAELDRQAQAIATRVGEGTESGYRRGDPYLLTSPELIETLAGPGTVLRYTGNTLVLRETDSGNPVLPFPYPELVELSELQPGRALRIEFTLPGSDVLLEGSAAPVIVGNETFGAIVLARPRSALGPVWPAVSQLLLVAAGVGLVASLALSLLLARGVVRPLADLKSATHRVAAGNLRTQLAPTGTRELDEVGDDFNRMVRELARRDGAARDFLMRITHDLRTPLTAIRGHAAALADGVVPEEAVPRSLGVIEDEAGRLEAMVSDLLDMARLDARRFRLDAAPATPKELLDRPLDAMRAPAAQAGVDLEHHLERLPEHLVTDEMRVRQIIGNLLNNAIQWSPIGGRVVLRGRGDTGGGLTVSVSDQGPGVPQARREEIFAPFTSAETPHGQQGAGLGLAISRQLARALGGDLWVEGPAEGGSRFVLQLPAHAPEATEA